MLLWYIMALEPPYGFYTPEMFTSRVFQQGHRPVIMADWPANICRMMKDCWNVNITVRPDFEAILDTIQQEVRLYNPEAANKLETTYMR
jgi:Protein tyrosine and serine/threonine kinase